MRLYYSPFACSLAAHIACREAGLEVELVRVDLATKQTSTGEVYLSRHPLEQVPALVLADGPVLTENIPILLYLTERHPDFEPRRRDARWQDYELLRWLSFLATEVHKKVLWPMYASGAPAAVKEYARASVHRPLEVLSERLDSREVLVGDSFSVADAFLLWALILLKHAGESFDRVPDLKQYLKTHQMRPAVQAALAYEKDQLERPFEAA